MCHSYYETSSAWFANKCHIFGHDDVYIQNYRYRRTFIYRTRFCEIITYLYTCTRSIKVSATFIVLQRMYMNEEINAILIYYKTSPLLHANMSQMVLLILLNTTTIILVCISWIWILNEVHHYIIPFLYNV